MDDAKRGGSRYKADRRNHDKQQHLGKRQFTARDFRPKWRQANPYLCQKASADRKPRRQVADMSGHFLRQEIKSVRGDCLVERRGFELMAIAALQLRIEEFRW
jgi:hypothetical protein